MWRCTMSVGSLEAYVGEFFVGFAAGRPAGPFAGKPPLNVFSQLEECAQRKPGVGTKLHSALPLGLANERG